MPYVRPVSAKIFYNVDQGTWEQLPGEYRDGALSQVRETVLVEGAVQNLPSNGTKGN